VVEFLAVMAALFLPAAWTAWALVGKLEKLSDPSRRAGLAVTTIDPSTYLLGELKVRLWVATLPPAAFGLFMMALTVEIALLNPSHDYHHRFGIREDHLIAGTFVSFSFLLQAALVITSLMNETWRACANGTRVNPWASASRAIGVGVLSSIGVLIGALLLAQPIADWNPLLGATLFVAIPIAAVGVAVWGRLRRSWEELVAAYLVVETEPR